MAVIAEPADGGGDASGPTIAHILPPRGPAAGGTTVRLLGSGFATPTSVEVAGTKVLSFHFVSDAEVQIVTPPGLPGDARVVVTVGGKKSPEHVFSYVAAPVITSASETGNRWITLQGTDLTPVLSASIGGAAASGIDVQATSVRIRRSAGPSGDMPIRVVTEGGSSPAFTISIKAGWSRIFVFWLATTYFFMLVALLVSYMLIPGFRNNLPGQLGPLPIVIPWTGALGAVTLSLSGVIYHSAHRDWDGSYLMWHIARPSLGAAFASIAYFIIAGGVLASGGTPNAQTTPVTAATPSSSPATTTTTAGTTTTTASRTTTASAVAAANAVAAGSATTSSSTTSASTPSAAPAANGGGLQNIFYIVAAFVIGYREQSFRQMIAKVSDLILGPGGSSSSGDGGPKHTDSASNGAAQSASNGGGGAS